MLNHVGKLCNNNPLLQLYAIGALAGPLLPLCTDLNGFGINIYGETTTGKSTCLHIVKSITGLKAYPWRTTSNAFESIAEKHNHATLALDDIGESDPDSAYEIAYMVGNTQGKARATLTMEVRDIIAWRGLCLSTGEVSAREHILCGP